MKPILALLAPFLVCACLAQEKYSGPRPPKPDVPYLMHADTLIELEAGEAREEQKKNDVTYTISGAASQARTPMAEPIFLFLSDKISPDDLELYRLDTKNGSRQVVINVKKRDSRPLRLSVTKLADKLFRVEVNEGLGLPNGEYSISPRGSNRVFCFQVY